MKILFVAAAATMSAVLLVPTLSVGPVRTADVHGTLAAVAQPAASAVHSVA